MKPITRADIAAYRQGHGIASRVQTPGVPRSNNQRPAQFGATAVPTSYVSSSYFEALQTSPNRAPVPLISFQSIRSYQNLQWYDTQNREQLAALGRWVVDNYDTAWFALNQIANYSTPVIPRAQSTDPAWNKLADQVWDDWSLVCDYQGRFNWRMLQRLGSLLIDTDGDFGLTFDRNPEGEPRIKFIPSWKIGGLIIGTTQNRMDGVWVGPDGQVEGYDVTFQANPVITKVSPDQMLLVMESERFERYRGMSAIRRGSNHLRDSQELLGYEKLLQKIDSSLAGVIQGKNPVMADDWDSPDDPSPGMSTARMPTSMQVSQLLGGEIPIIDGEFKQLATPRTTTDKSAFMQTLQAHFVAGLGLPPAFIANGGLTGPATRGVLGQAQKRFNLRIDCMATMARWCWVRVMGDAIANGRLPAVDGWQRARTQAPALVSIDLGDQAAADLAAVQAGLMTRQSYFGARAKDWQAELDQMIAEDDYLLTALAAVAKKTGVPIEIILARYGYEPNQVPQPPSNNKKP